MYEFNAEYRLYCLGAMVYGSDMFWFIAAFD